MQLLKQLVLLSLLVFGFQFRVELEAQSYYPVKIDNRWGLINDRGQMVREPVYEAIGEYQQYGYAIMQRDGGVGLLDDDGIEVVPPQYEDLRVLDSTLFAVMDRGAWMVVDLRGQTIVEKGYEQLKVWEGEFLGFRRDDRWGVMRKDGRRIIDPQFDDISIHPQGYFLGVDNYSLGLLSIEGEELLPPKARDIQIVHPDLILYQEGKKWGGIDSNGLLLFPAIFQAYQILDSTYLKLWQGAQLHLYAQTCKALIAPQAQYDNLHPIGNDLVIVARGQKVGLLDACGKLLLKPVYEEIQPFHNTHYRVVFEGKWGLMQAGDRAGTAFEFDYLAPLRDGAALFRKGESFGLLSPQGERLLPAEYEKIELDAGEVRAYRTSGALELFRFDGLGKLLPQGQLTQHFRLRVRNTTRENVTTTHPPEYRLQLRHFEWFYRPERDRWGLRKTSDGEVVIDPIFTHLKIDREWGITLVGVPSDHTYDFERTTYRFHQVYGIVDNQIGKLVSDLHFLDIRLEEFDRAPYLARVWLKNGRFGLLNRSLQLVAENFAYIGAFREGYARASLVGKLSGSVKQTNHLGSLQDFRSGLSAASSMIDFTEYDQLFDREAQLYCENCQWSYLDTTGAFVKAPAYDFAEDFTHGVGIVQRNGRWGMIDRTGKQIIPCRYDGLEFLENTNNQILRLYVQQTRYGLIDTSGRLCVRADFDEIGRFSENRLSVLRDGRWGFVDAEGNEVVPCRFQEVKPYSEGLAAVKLGRQWGFIDKMGNTVIPFRYLRAGNFRSGKAWVYRSQGVGYINPNGDEVIPFQFDRAFDFEGGVARVVIDQKYGLINSAGEFVLRPRFNEIRAFDRNGRAVVSYGRQRVRYGLIDATGNLVTHRAYTFIGPFAEGLAVVKDREQYGYINTEGQEVLPLEYSKAAPFSEGRAAVQRDGYCGYIDRSGNQLVPFEFTRCKDFQDGKAVVYQGMRKAGLVNHDGQLVLEPSINRLLNFREGRGLVRDERYRFYYITETSGRYHHYYERASEFRNGVAVVQVDGKWGVINQRGMELVPPKYDKIESFDDGYAKVKVEGLTGVSNLQGELLAPPDFEVISYAGNGLFRAEQGDKVGYFDWRGDWVWRPSD